MPEFREATLSNGLRIAAEHPDRFAKLFIANGFLPIADRPVTLSWNNGQGLQFKRTYAIDKNFMFTVTQEVVNATSAPGVS